MRFEELSNNLYQKNTDSVERYLLSLVEEFMSEQSTANPLSREYVIQQAVARAKEELNFDGIGVTSIQLPDDEEPRTGAVKISLEELHGEPRIDEKRSAFNVDFGTEINTACEGNDPRLSDARPPLPHQHEISDVQGLEGLLSTYKANSDYSMEHSHTHDNQSILDKLEYSGTNLSIDLAVYENWEQELYSVLNQINTAITSYKNEINTKINNYETNVTTKYNTIIEKLDGIPGQISTALTMIKAYCDNQISSSTTNINTLLNDYVTKNEIDALIEPLKDIYIPVGTAVIQVSNYITPSQKLEEIITFNVTLPNSILNILYDHLPDAESDETSSMSIFDMLSNDSFVDSEIISNGKRSYGDLISYDSSGNINGILTFSFNTSSLDAFQINIYNPDKNLPTIINNATIKVTLHLKLRYLL